jgi:hypothetical protein
VSEDGTEATADSHIQILGYLDAVTISDPPMDKGLFCIVAIDLYGTVGVIALVDLGGDASAEGALALYTSPNEKDSVSSSASAVRPELYSAYTSSKLLLLLFRHPRRSNCFHTGS